MANTSIQKQTPLITYHLRNAIAARVVSTVLCLSDYTRIIHILGITWGAQYGQKLGHVRKWLHSSAVADPGDDVSTFGHIALIFFRQEAQLSLTNRAMPVCKVVQVLQDFLSENAEKKFNRDYNVILSSMVSELYDA